MEFKTLLSVTFLVSTCYAVHDFNIYNKCNYTVWIGILGKGQDGKNAPSMAPGSTHKITVQDKFSGRVWGKTHCDATGNKCASPNTLAEITFDANGIDFYDVSLVDGYNLPIRMNPTAGTFDKGTSENHYFCTSAGCDDDLNTHCPEELSVKADGKTIVCLSACAKFKTDEYCCGGAHNKPQTCKSTDWPVNYPAIFKKSCPDAYSYAYDDAKSTFTCRGKPTTSYDIIFCPHTEK